MRDGAKASGKLHGEVAELVYAIASKAIECELLWVRIPPSLFFMTRYGNRESMTTDAIPLETIPSLVAWYDAADTATVNAVGNVVREWLDKSRNGWDLKPSAALGQATSPIYISNGLSEYPVIACNGISPLLRTVSPFQIVGKDPRSLFVIASGGAANRPGSVVHWGVAERSRAYGVALEENIVLYRWSDNMFLATNDQQTPAFVSATFDGTTHKAWLNGYLATQDTHEIDTAPTELQIGGRGTSMYPGIFTGNICEIVIFDRALSERERVFIEGALAWKWGLEQYLPPIHTFANVSPKEANSAARYA